MKIDLENSPLDTGVFLEAGQARIMDACRLFGVRVLALFGSHARRRPHPSSDLDLAVRFEQDPTPEQELRFLETLIEVLRTDRVDLVNVEKAGPLVLRDIGLEAIPLYESAPGSFAQVQTMALARFLDTAHFRRLRSMLLKSRPYSSE